MLHRIRQRHVGERTALVNQIRGLLSEYGVIVALGWRKLREALPRILEDGENELTVVGREQIARLQEELMTLCGWIEEDNRRLEQMRESNQDYQRLMAPGDLGRCCPRRSLRGSAMRHSLTRAVTWRSGWG